MSRALKLDMLLNFRIFIIAIIFFIFPLKSIYSKDFIIKDAIDPYCNGVDAELFLEEKKIKDIIITTDNPRKWTKNIFRALLEFNSEDSKTENTDWFNFRINEKYKKNFKSKLFVNFEDGISCKFRAKIRMTGDLWWHLDWKKGTALTSIQVRLLDGHINNITRFKLFLPKSRQGAENEVFTSSFLTELGFLAPRTFVVKSKINGIKGNYIFQEDIRKEFLENIKLLEGPLLEGDERFTVSLKEDSIPTLSLSRIINKNFSLKGETNQKIALTAVAKLNLIYLQHHQVKTSIEKLYLPQDRLYINTEKFFLDKNNKSFNQIYDALIYALDAYHSLSSDDRRFYFDPINQNFIPIYYDGKSKIVDDVQSSTLEQLSQKVTIDAKNGADEAIELINNISHQDFITKLNNKGINISTDHYEEIIKKIIKRLDVIKKSSPLPVEFLKTKKYFSQIDKKLIKNRKLIFVNSEEKEFYICSFNLKKCQTKKDGIEKFNNSLANILSQRYTESDKSTQIGDEYIFVYENINYEKSQYTKVFTWKIMSFDDNFFIKYNDGIKINSSTEKKKINIEQTSDAGRAVITGKKIDGWNIIFNGYQMEQSTNIPSNYLGLTGCLTFLDIEVKNISLDSNNSLCEDSINFIRVKGDVNSVNIKESFSDAFDLDFSNVEIDLIKIESSGNDCLDLSYGNYTINNIIAENCAEKGISVGEKTKAVLKEVSVKNSNIAVAAKDSSLVDIHESQILKSPICFSAYRKKQEFSGGRINILNTNCNEENFYIQKGSKIVLGL